MEVRKRSHELQCSGLLGVRSPEVGLADLVNILK